MEDLYPYVEHGPKRLWYAPWRRVCRCGESLDGPRASRLEIRVEDVYPDRLGHVRGRRSWTGGAR
jgi:hypothetical protein